MATQIDNFALIIGAAKCGTTSLFAYLSQHPQIAACRASESIVNSLTVQKEVNFFTENWHRGFEWYMSLWDWNSSIHRVALEATVNYTKVPICPNAAERIATLQDRADFKFIYIMRDPIERIESQYTYGLSRGVNYASIEKGKMIDSNLLAPSMYSRQLKEYYLRFPDEQILLVNFEDLKKKPREVCRRVCNFLEIDPEYPFQGFEKVYNPITNRYVDDRAWRTLRDIDLLRYTVRAFIPAKDKAILHSLFGKRLERKISISPSLKNIVIEELKDDLNWLKSEYKFDTDSWINVQNIT
jgi:hypothetical protein